MEYGGQIAVVTGGSSGLGRRLALDLARAGADVVAVARREDRLAALAEEMRAANPRCRYQVCDLTDVAAFVALLGDVERDRGRIDILLNIAGIGGIDRTQEPTLDGLREVLEINFVAPYAGMLTVLPGMRRRRHGVIANMSSDDGRAPGPGAGDYAASKAALSAATESIFYDTRSDGVTAHVIYPGWVPTEMGLEAVREGGMPMPPRAVRRSEEQVSSLVLRRLGAPRVEINAAALPMLAPLLRSVAPRSYHRLRAAR
ncbi:MAG TPA: SDR family oxidoreductase [Mycobacteriales bacterium]|nr:SDR family oxidoreductase [Mycobacteriales bacterium]